MSKYILDIFFFRCYYYSTPEKLNTHQLFSVGDIFFLILLIFFDCFLKTVFCKCFTKSFWLFNFHQLFFAVFGIIYFFKLSKTFYFFIICHDVSLPFQVFLRFYQILARFLSHRLLGQLQYRNLNCNILILDIEKLL